MRHTVHAVKIDYAVNLLFKTILICVERRSFSYLLTYVHKPNFFFFIFCCFFVGIQKCIIFWTTFLFLCTYFLVTNTIFCRSVLSFCTLRFGTECSGGFTTSAFFALFLKNLGVHVVSHKTLIQRCCR